VKMYFKFSGSNSDVAQKDNLKRKREKRQKRAHNGIERRTDVHQRKCKNSVGSLLKRMHAVLENERKRRQRNGAE